MWLPSDASQRFWIDGTHDYPRFIVSPRMQPPTRSWIMAHDDDKRSSSVRRVERVKGWGLDHEHAPAALAERRCVSTERALFGDHDGIVDDHEVHAERAERLGRTRADQAHRALRGHHLSHDRVDQRAIALETADHGSPERNG